MYRPHECPKATEKSKCSKSKPKYLKLFKYISREKKGKKKPSRIMATSQSRSS